MILKDQNAAKPLIILGEKISSPLYPWNYHSVSAVMLNAYEILKHNLLSKLRRVGLREYLELGEEIEIWLDSGGFQIMNKKAGIGVSELAQVYRQLNADYYISLDVPPLPENPPSLRKEKREKTFSYFQKLRQKLDTKAKKIIPVIHYNSNLEKLDESVAKYSEYGCNLFAIGGLVPYILTQKGTKHARKKAVLNIRYLRLLLEEKVLHIMGLGSPATIPLLNLLGISSTDSNSWRIKAAYGNIILPWRGERNVTKEAVQFGKTKLKKKEQKELVKFIKEETGDSLSLLQGDACSSLNEVFQNFEKRAILNSYLLTHMNKKREVGGRFKYLYNFTKRIKELSLEEIKKIGEKINMKQRTLDHFE